MPPKTFVFEFPITGIAHCEILAETIDDAILGVQSWDEDNITLLEYDLEIPKHFTEIKDLLIG